MTTRAEKPNTPIATTAPVGEPSSSANATSDSAENGPAIAMIRLRPTLSTSSTATATPAMPSAFIRAVEAKAAISPNPWPAGATASSSAPRSRPAAR